MQQNVPVSSNIQRSPLEPELPVPCRSSDKGHLNKTNQIGRTIIFTHSLAPIMLLPAKKYS